MARLSARRRAHNFSPTGPPSPPVTCAATIASRYRRPAGPATAQCSVSPAQPNTISRTCWSGSPCMLVCITGVSGSGKARSSRRPCIAPPPEPSESNRSRWENFRRSKAWNTLNGVRLIDQQPIGRTPAPTRSPISKPSMKSVNCSPLNEMPCGRASPRAFLVQRGGDCERCKERLRKAGDVLLRGYLRDLRRVQRSTL